MFKPRGLFKGVSCPGKHDCNLPNCIFDHESPVVNESSSDKTLAYDPAAIGEPSPPPAKRRKLDIEAVPHAASVQPKNATISEIQLNGTTKPTQVVQSEYFSLKREHDDLDFEIDLDLDFEDDIVEAPPAVRTKPVPKIAKANELSLSTAQPVSATKTVSPPPTSRKPVPVKVSVPKAKPPPDEPFHPRRVEHPPLQLSERDKKLKMFHQALKKKQDKLRKELTADVSLLMSEKELQRLALDEEESVAKSASAATYSTMLSGRLTFHNVMTPITYKAWITQRRTASIPTQSGTKASPVSNTEIDTGLGSVDKEISILKMLRTGLHSHAAHGYVVKKPTDVEIAKAKAAETATQGFEKCDRCERRFQVFPGRDPTTGQLASGGTCSHHWGRFQQGKFTCCNQQAGGQACVTALTHVFKTTDPARLALLWQFEETPTKIDNKKRGPVVFDCEMGYTTQGFELVRVTALSWPLKAVLLDILVQPFGEILDLNTRFSGVTPQMFADAPPYNSTDPPKYVPGEKLQKVRSPKIARDLLFDLLDPNTPLIGHAIDNDLNACRVIHPFVIDTVLLYPTIRGLPFRRKLKDLAREHLHRSIQNESATGHDSKEDSEATGDLARVKVKEKWEQLVRQGFGWDRDVLLPNQARRKTGAQTLLTSSPRQRIG